MVSRPGWVSELGNTGVGVFVVDGAQRVVTWNKTAERLLGYSASEVVGRPCYEVIGGRRRTGSPCCGPHCGVQQSMRGKAPVESFDLLTKSKNGDDVWLTVSVLVLAIPGDPLVVHVFGPVRHRDQLIAPMAVDANHGVSDVLAPLSHRERSVLELLVDGRTTAEISASLAISGLTVRTHVRNMLTKTGVRSRLQLVLLAVRSGLRPR